MVFVTMLTVLLLITLWPHIRSQSLPDAKDLTRKTYRSAVYGPLPGDGDDDGPEHILVYFHATTERSRDVTASLESAMARFPPGAPTVLQVDCTKEERLCEDELVHDLPTIGYVRRGRGWGRENGRLMEYTGERDADTLVGLAEKLIADAVAPVRDVPEGGGAYYYDDILASSLNGVAFVAYDPNASGSTASEVLLSTPTLRAFRDFAAERKVRGPAFGVMMPGADGDGSAAEAARFGHTHGGGDDDDGDVGPFAIRIERGVEPRTFAWRPSLLRRAFLGGRPSAGSLDAFYRENDLPAVTPLGRHNLRDLAHRGGRRPLAILLTMGDASSPSSSPRNARAADELRRFAIGGPRDVTGAFAFASMDASYWYEFRQHFAVSARDMPEVIVYDEATGRFWRDVTRERGGGGGGGERGKGGGGTVLGGERLQSFLSGVAAGDVEPIDEGDGPRDLWSTARWAAMGEGTREDIAIRIVLFVAMAYIVTRPCNEEWLDDMEAFVVEMGRVMDGEPVDLAKYNKRGKYDKAPLDADKKDE